MRLTINQVGPGECSSRVSSNMCRFRRWDPPLKVVDGHVQTVRRCDAGATNLEEESPFFHE